MTTEKRVSQAGTPKGKKASEKTCRSCFYYQQLGGGSKGTCVFKGTISSGTARDCPWYEKE